MTKLHTSNILVISEGPPPIGNTVAEGGALRAWGLAKGLAYHGFSVTFAYRSTFDGSFSTNDIPANIIVTTWNGKSIGKLLENHKIIIMRYAMGEAAQITNRLKDDHILVSDSYIPISIEVAARKSNDVHENYNYLALQESSAYATRRADYFLYASPAQKSYYIGYLAGLNKLNPTTYPELEQRMFEIPYGVDPHDENNKLINRSDSEPTLLWYGAFYSWFDMESLVTPVLSIKKKVPNFKLLVAGAKNPYNKDVGILAHYERTMKALEPLEDCVEYIDWHPFDKRFEVYARASAIITWNHEGLENQFAWRTRLMDFVLSCKPIITNGGDPLGEDLIKRGIAFRANAQDLDKVFSHVVENPPKRTLFEDTSNRYSWINLVKPLAETLRKPTNMAVVNMEPGYYTLASKIKKRFLLPLIIFRSAKEYGAAETLGKISRAIKLRFR